MLFKKKDLVLIEVDEGTESIAMKDLFVYIVQEGLYAYRIIRCDRGTYSALFEPEAAEKVSKFLLDNGLKQRP